MLRTKIFICISLLWSINALGRGAKRKEKNLSPNIEISENQNWQREFPVFFIADNQFHNIYGGSSLFRTWLSDSIVNVSIRPPRLDLFAPFLYEWSVRNFTKRKKFIIHLGDAIDISCKNEWNIFIKKMNGLGKKGWVLAPGNHDSTFYGNWAPSTTTKSSTGFGKSWNTSCSNQYPNKQTRNLRDQALIKDDFVKLYLKELIKQGKVFPSEFPINSKNLKCNTNQRIHIHARNGHRVRMKRCYWKSSNKNSFLQKVFTRWPNSGDPRHAFRSFVLQEIDLNFRDSKGKKFKAIILDTTDFHNAPKFITGIIGSFLNKWFGINIGVLNPGLTGEIDSYQIEIAKNWLRGNKENVNWIFMGHHQIRKLSKKSVDKIKDLMKIKPNSIYLSGHSHESFLNKDEVIKEINLGSITDRPELTFIGIKNKRKRGKDILEYIVKRKKVTTSMVSRSYLCRSSLNAKKHRNPIFRYRGYKKIKYPDFIQDHTLNMLIKGYFDMLINLGYRRVLLNSGDLYEKVIKTLTDYNQCKNFWRPNFRKSCMKEKFHLLRKLEHFDRVRIPNRRYRTKRLIYGACQGIWASEEEFY